MTTSPASSPSRVIECTPLLSGAPLDDHAAASLAAVLRVLGDPARLRILSLIQAQPSREACVCHLTDTLGLSQPTVSHHLRVLYGAGLLGRERRGNWVYYRAVPGALDDVREALGGNATGFLRNQPGRVLEHLRLSLTRREPHSSDPMHLLVVGGSDAGISAALRARELRSDIDVSVIVADAFPNFSVCGLPYFLSGEVPDWRKLAHRSLDELERMGIRFELNTRATGIEPDRHAVVVEALDGPSQTRSYDRLIVATGALPIRPETLNLDQPAVHVLHTMEDSLRLHERLARGDVREVAIVGSGYIGLEMAEGLLTHRGIHVTLLGRSGSVLPSVGKQFGDLVTQELRHHGVDVRSGVEVVAIEQHGKRLAVRDANAGCVQADLVLVAAGVRPNSELAARAGVETGPNGALRVDRRMATNLPDVFAAGDCVETWHRLLERVTYVPLGTTAHKQGRVAGENAVGGQREFQGSVGTQVVRVFDLVAARTGLRDDDARAAGFDPLTVETSAWDHTPYYPGAHQVRMRITGDRTTGRLLGALLLGPSAAEIDKRIDVYATALFNGLSVDAINDLDLSYTPPFGTPWDAVQNGAQAWERSVRVATAA